RHAHCPPVACSSSLYTSNLPTLLLSTNHRCLHRRSLRKSVVFLRAQLHEHGTYHRVLRIWHCALTFQGLVLLCADHESSIRRTRSHCLEPTKTSGLRSGGALSFAEEILLRRFRSGTSLLLEAGHVRRWRE